MMAQQQANMPSIWEDWYDVLFQPLIAMQTVSSQCSKSRALFTMLLCLCPLWLVYLATEDSISEFTGLLVGLHIIAELVVWLCGSAILHLAAAFLGGRGEAVGLFCSLGYAGLPQLFLIPAAALATCLPSGLRTITLAAALTLLLVWSFILKLLAIRGCYSFSTSTSFLVLLSPLVALMALAAMGAVLLSASFLSMAL